MKRGALLGLLTWLLLAPSMALAQDLESRLSSAEATAASAEEQIVTSTDAASRAQKRLATISPKVERASAAAATALSEVSAIEEELAASRTDALEEVQALEENYRSDKETHDDEVSSGIGLSIASLLFAAIALFWARFRTLPPVAWLADQRWLPAAALCVGGALAVLIAGGAMIESSASVVKMIGALLVGIGLGLPVALLIARHSLRVERGVGQPLFSRERLPRWLASVLAGLLLLLFVGGLGSGLSSEEPEAPQIPAEKRELAEAAADDPLDPPTQELLTAQAAASPLVARAEELGSARDEAQRAFDQAQVTLLAARNQLAQASTAANRLSARIAQQQAAAIPEPSTSDSGSSTSYENCDSAPSNIPVPPGSSLDGDGDGIGCES